MKVSFRALLVLLIAGSCGCAPLYYLLNPGEFFRQNTNINGAMPLGPDDQLRTVVLPVALAGTDILNDPRCYERIRGTTWDYIYYFTFFLSYPPAPLDSAKCLEIAYRKFYGYPDAAPSVTPTPSVTASLIAGSVGTTTLSTPAANATAPPTQTSEDLKAQRDDELKARRNQVQEVLIGASNQQCTQFTEHLNSYQAYTNLGLGLMATGTGAAGAITPQTFAARTLSGTAGALSGFRAEFNSDIFAKELASTITAQIGDARQHFLSTLRPCASPGKPATQAPEAAATAPEDLQASADKAHKKAEQAGAQAALDAKTADAAKAEAKAHPKDDNLKSLAEKKAADAEQSAADAAAAKADADKAKAEVARRKAQQSVAKAGATPSAAATSAAPGKTAGEQATAKAGAKSSAAQISDTCGRQDRSIEQYPVEAAVADAITYNDLCSLRAGLEHLQLTSNVLDTAGLTYLATSLEKLKTVQTNLNAISASPTAAASPAAAK